MRVNGQLIGTQGRLSLVAQLRRTTFKIGGGNFRILGLLRSWGSKNK